MELRQWWKRPRSLNTTISTRRWRPTVPGSKWLTMDGAGSRPSRLGIMIGGPIVTAGGGFIRTVAGTGTRITPGAGLLSTTGAGFIIPDGVGVGGLTVYGAQHGFRGGTQMRTVGGHHCLLARTFAMGPGSPTMGHMSELDSALAWAGTPGYLLTQDIFMIGKSGNTAFLKPSGSKHFDIQRS